MAQEKKSEKVYATDELSYGESIRRHAAMVAVFTVGGGFLGYFARDFLVKHLGVETRTGEIIGVVGGAAVGFITATIVVSEMDQAILETAAAVEAETLGCTRRELDEMSGQQKLLHLIKVLPELAGPELSALIPGLSELQGVLKQPQPQPQWPQQPPQWVVAPAPPAPPTPDLATMLASLDPAAGGRLGAQLMARAAAAKKAAAEATPA